MENSNSHLIRLLTATFDLPLRGHEIPHWRGAFVELAGLESSDLFHNHDNSLSAMAEEEWAAIPAELNGQDKPLVSSKRAGRQLREGRQPIANSQQPTAEKFHYRYPMVHYRSIRGKAAIFAMNEGIAALQEVLASTNWEIVWKGQPLTLQLEGLEMKDHYLQLNKDLQHYRLRHWLPFNDDNYRRWLDCPDLHAKVNLLESILPAQILNFCSGADWQLPRRFDLRLTDLHACQEVRLHNIQRIMLDVTYAANLLLPAGLALGKGVSHGFGCQHPLRRD